MQAWVFQPVVYVPSKPLPQVWPLPPVEYEPEVGERAFEHAIEQAVIAEHLGFDGVSSAEHHYAAACLTPNPTVMAAALSQRLHRAKIILLGTTLPLTNPVRVAEEYAMLDNLSGGRLIAGMLRGTPNEFLTYGTNPEETREKYEEGVELILKAWSEPQPFGWQGRHYQFRTVSVWPRPLQQPHPPVFVSGNSEVSASFAARKRLNMGFSFIPIPVAVPLASFYREEAVKAGWEPTPDNMMYRGFIHVAETDQKAIEEVKATYWRLPGSDPITNPEPGPLARSGGIAVSSKMDVKRSLSSDVFSAIKMHFCGSPRSVLEQIRHLRDKIGVGTIEFVFQGTSLPHEMTLRSMELFGKEVLPQMHEL